MNYTVNTEDHFTKVTIYDIQTINIYFDGKNHMENANAFILSLLIKQGRIGY